MKRMLAVFASVMAVASLVVVMFNGVTVESSLVGNDGVVGIELPL